MPKVTITIDYSTDDFGHNEVVQYSRDVADLDQYDWVHYLATASEHAGFLVDQVALYHGDKVWKTDI